MKPTSRSTLLIFIAALAACGGGAMPPTPSPTVSATAVTVITPSSTAVIPTAVPTVSTASASATMPPTPGSAPTVMPRVALPSATSRGTAGAATPSIRAATPTALYVANFAAWFTGERTTPAPIRAGFDPAAGEYHLAIASADTYYSYYAYLPDRPRFADFRLDVDVRRVSGPANGGTYGILVRAQPQGAGDATNARYIFLLQPQEGYFALNLINASGPATNVVPRTTTPAIRRGEATNHLTVTCRGGTIIVAINDQVVGAYPATLVAAGEVGLLIENPRDPVGPSGMEVAFSNLRISGAP